MKVWFNFYRDALVKDRILTSCNYPSKSLALEGMIQTASYIGTYSVEIKLRLRGIRSGEIK